MARNIGINQSANRRTRMETSQVEYSDEELAWLKAIEDFKKTEGRTFPTWSDVLDIAKAEGYRKVAEPMSVKEYRLSTE